MFVVNVLRRLFGKMIWVKGSGGDSSVFQIPTITVLPYYLTSLVATQCFLCKKELSWTDCEDDGVEILPRCFHSYHKSCLDLYVEEKDKECPQCFVVFSD